MTKHTSDCVKDAFQRLCEATDTPYALKASLLLRSSDKEFLAQLETPVPCRYLDASSFRADYLIYNYLRKYVGLETGINTREVAIEKWTAAEEQCSKSNLRLKSGSYLGYDVESAFLRARRKISRLLGDFCFSKVLTGNGMGPGATFDVSRHRDPGTKYKLPISVTNSCSKYAKAWLEHDIHWLFPESPEIVCGPYSVLDSVLLYCHGNKMTTVPKDASTDRCISIEPTFNLFFQKGVGSYIRRKLKAFGVDLDDQSRNQDLARLARVDSLATLDLSSASDTICCELVKNLLPLDWWLYLDDIRSKSTRVSKTFVKTEKFSSMGNGFTFELETLIFWSLAPDCDVVSVYGDDIICNQSVASEYITVLEGMGFTINKAKSFVDGPFYESCGKHFFEGVDVSPAFQKEKVYHPSHFTRAHNRLFKIHDRVHGCEIARSPELWASQVFFDRYPYRAKPFVPHTADDRGFYTYRMSSFYFDPNRGYKCPVLKLAPRKVRTINYGLYISKLQVPTSNLWLDRYGRRRVSGEDVDVKLGWAWIQPFALTCEWLPQSF